MKNQQKVYVTVWHTEQAYGGPEEGGWYYQQGEPVEGVYTLCCMAEGVRVEFSEDEWGVSNRVDDHDDTCPARGAYEGFHNAYVANHQEQYLHSFVTANGTYDPDGPDDAPDELVGEVATSGNYHVSFDREPPESFPKYRPHYE